MNILSETKTLGVVTGVVIATLFLSGCEIVGYPKSPDTSTFVLGLIDASGTTKGDRAAYTSELSMVLDQMRGGDSLWADAITESSLATARIPIKAELPRFSVFTTNEDDYRKQLSEQKSVVRAKFDGWITAQETPRTTILDAMMLAQKVLLGAAAKGASRRILVIFSDMLEDDGQYRFDAMDLSPAVVQRILQKEKAAGRIADLRGVTVYVSGATANRKSERRKIQQVEAFWRSYFTAAGTALADERYGATLLELYAP